MIDHRETNEGVFEAKPGVVYSESRVKPMKKERDYHRARRALQAVALAAAAIAFSSIPSRAVHLNDPVKLMWQPPEIGKALNNLTLPDPLGEEHSLSDFRGKVILLSFWSCYTDSCFTSVQVISDYLEEFHERGFVVLSVCSEVPPSLAEDAYSDLLSRCSKGQTMLIDADKAVTDRYRLHTSQLPTSYLVGRDYLVYEIVAGASRLRTPDFRKKIMKLLGREPAPGR